MTRLIDNAHQNRDPEIGAEKSVAYLAIAGMECANCARRI